MSTWRLLDTGRLSAAENIALDESLLESKKEGKIPNTIRFLQFFPPAVLIGFHQSKAQEVRVGFCDSTGIDINRRITGGGAIFLDQTQLGWEIICEKQFFNQGIADVTFFEQLCQPLIDMLRSMGVNAVFRPKNDIEVNGRKISGVGGTEDGGAFLFQGTLLVDFDVHTMLRSLRIPIEKLQDKEIESVKERVTCLQEELGYTPPVEELKSLLKKSFEKMFHITLVTGNTHSTLVASLFDFSSPLLQQKRSKKMIFAAKNEKNEPTHMLAAKRRTTIIDVMSAQFQKIFSLQHDTM